MDVSETMDISESSVYDSNDEEYAPPATPVQSTSSQPANRGRQSGLRGRGRGRGRGRRPGVSEENLHLEDAARVQELRSRRMNFERECIQGLSLQEAHNVLQLVLQREPGVIFDVLQQSGPAAGGSQAGSQPPWCICTRCREMPTDLEKKCCQQQPIFCISTMPHMDAFIVEEGVLRLARRLWNDLRALFDDFDDSAYRQYIAWQYGHLGAGNRVVIPSCVVWAIRSKYPDPNGQYTGFIPRRL